MADEDPGDGGPAFPRTAHYEDDVSGYDHAGQDGMSLRDYFAAKAMAALIDGYDHEIRQASVNHADRTGFDDVREGGATFAYELAGEAYIIADAMLAQRNR